MILSLLYVSFAVEDVDRTRRAFRDLFGLPGERMEPDPFLGTDRGARLAFPNACWLYVAESHQASSPVFQFVQRRGPGLERIAFLSDDIEGEFRRVQQGGVPLVEDALAHTPQGRRFVVSEQYVRGVTVEILQPAPGLWTFDAPASISGVLGLQHIGTATLDLQAASKAFQRLFDLHPAPVEHAKHLSFAPGNDFFWLDVAEGRKGESDRVGMFLENRGEGLEHLCLEVEDIREAVRRVTRAGALIHENKIYTNRPNGLEAFVYPEHTTGVTVELIEPHPTSPGYRERLGRRGRPDVVVRGGAYGR